MARALATSTGCSGVDDARPLPQEPPCSWGLVISWEWTGVLPIAGYAAHASPETLCPFSGWGRAGARRLVRLVSDG